MALQLLKKVYGQAVTADGPTLAAGGASATATTVTLPFRDAEGLHTEAVSAAIAGCAVSPFELGYPSGNWTRAAPTVKGNTVELTIVAGAQADSELDAAGPTEVRYAWEGFPQCALYSGVGGFNGTALPAAPFRVAIGAACGAGQTRCELGAVSIGADKGAAQCCSKAEDCVPYGGCQAVDPK